MTGLIGLTRFSLRRSRLLVLAWTAVLVVITYASAAATGSLYATTADQVSAARAINTAQSKFAALNGGKYGRREDLTPHLDAARYNLLEGADIAPGFTLTLDAAGKIYWFLIKDKTDPCGFSYISNQDGLIFVAQPIR